MPTATKRALLARLRQTKSPLTKWQKQEIDRSAADVEYFVDRHCLIYNATVSRWVRFRLWDAQRQTLGLMVSSQKLIVCKARQLGLSWLTLTYILWVMLFHPIAAILIFSKRDDEAEELLRRLKDIYYHLPIWMQTQAVRIDSMHVFELANGSRATAFPTTGGRSYTGTMVVVDEADFIPGFGDLLNAVQPTIDAGGKMVVISTVDKKRPGSPFKNMFAAAMEGLTDWVDIFLAWWERPGRDAAWYDRQKADIFARDGSLDDLHQEYPATVAEAFAPRTQDKAIPADWIAAMYEKVAPIQPDDAPFINTLAIYAAPVAGGKYVIGVDPAEGNPTSDDSALTVISVADGAEVASLSGKFQPSIIGEHAVKLAKYYNGAGIMVERNNHGHSVILSIQSDPSARLLVGEDKKPGWLSNPKGKTLLYDSLVDYCREHYKAGTTPIHNFQTFEQIASIEGASLRAPEGFMDDRADSYALAVVGIPQAARDRQRTRSGRVAGRENRQNIRTARRAVR